MRKRSRVGLCLLAFAVFSVAQDKIESKWNCAKPSEMHSLDVGDTAGHSYVVAQGACTATSSTNGEKSAAYTEFQEVWKTKFTNHGRLISTADNGDKVYYTYEGSGPMDLKKLANNKWKIVDATGKHKGMKASGTCSGDRHDDGTSDWTCTGTSSAAK